MPNSISPYHKKNALKLLAFCSRKLPLPFLSAFAYFLSWILAYLLKRDRHIALVQLRYALPDAPTKKLYRQAIFNSIMTVFEIFRIREILGNPSSKQVSGPPGTQVGAMKIIGLDEFKKAKIQAGVDLPQSAGGVCLSAHCGNFDLMAACFSFQNFPMSVIARKANDPVYHEFLVSLREGYGIQMLWRENAAGSKNLIGAIRSNRFLCALIDQDVALENGFTPFFGIPAAHPIAPIKIAVRFEKPVYACFARRIKMGQHECHVHRIYWEEVASEPEQFIMREYSRLLEKFIRNYPDQWVWWHRRWRRREGIDYEKHPEKLPSTSEYLNWIKSLTGTGRTNFNQIS